MIIPNVALLHFDDQGRVLVVERKDDPAMIGLPGGKADPADIIDAGCDLDLALRIACSREALEEAGLVIFPHSLVEVYRGSCATPKRGGEWPNVAFMARRVVTTVPRDCREPPFHYVQPHDLLVLSPFHDFNKRLFDALGILY